MANYYCKASRDCGCTIWNYGETNPDLCINCLDYVEKKEHTNADYIRSLSSSDLAELLVQTHEESEYDYDWDENLIDTGYTRLCYVTSDGERFEDGYYNDAIVHEIEWLNSKYEDYKFDV